MGKDDKQKFEVGDTVSWMGLEGTVKDFCYYTHNPMMVSFPNGDKWYFIEDGRMRPDHTEPALKLIAKAKKYKEVVKWTWCVEPIGSKGTRPFDTAAYFEDELALRIDYPDDSWKIHGKNEYSRRVFKVEE